MSICNGCVLSCATYLFIVDAYLKVICRPTFKVATGRPYVRAFSLSGTVPAFTCDCSSTCVCLRLREQCLRSEITSVSRVANVLTLAFCRR